MLVPVTRREPRPTASAKHAADDLRFIRETLERSGRFTAIPGAGVAALGGIAFTAAALAQQARDARTWLWIWAAAAGAGIAVGLAAVAVKARRSGMPAFSGPARRFLAALLPAVAAGALVTVPLVSRGQTALVPALWMLFYGVGLFAAALGATRIVAVAGLWIASCGAAALVLPARMGNELLAAGLGAGHVAAGVAVLLLDRRRDDR
ncbi:MAG: hypothetical protein HMLKMBBP_00192 [Planctomycetes bacterium]|nr:hypothetical protein [Planctomycetota bacterium]